MSTIEVQTLYLTTLDFDPLNTSEFAPMFIRKFAQPVCLSQCVRKCGAMWLQKVNDNMRSFPSEYHKVGITWRGFPFGICVRVGNAPWLASVIAKPPSKAR